MRRIKRPRLHHAIIVGYVLAPVVNIALLLLFTRLPLALVLRRLFAGYGVLAGIWLLTAPLAGISLYFVHRASWYVFLAHSSLILLDFAWKWIARPGYYLATIPRLNNALILLGNLGLVAAIGYLIRRDFRAPYFQALRRHWRESVRIPMRHEVFFGGATRQTDDLSTGGCFIVGSDRRDQIGLTLPLSFRLGRLEVECRGEIMRVIEAGCGVRFVTLPWGTARMLRQALRNRFALRYRIDLPAAWQAGVSPQSCSLVNISSRGCYLRTDGPPPAEGTRGTLSLGKGAPSRTLAATVVWANDKGEHGKPPGCGLRFTLRHRLLVKALLGAGPFVLTR